jgi:hypothetical protein
MMIDRATPLVRVTMLALLGVLSACSRTVPTAQKEEGPEAGNGGARSQSSSERNAYFGDLHLHTKLSLDAFLAGVQTAPEDAYRYAKGEPVTYMGREVRRHAALDFIAITDHAEFLGVLDVAARADGPFAGSEWYRLLNSGDPAQLRTIFGRVNRERPPEFLDEELRRTQWKRIIDAAEAHYAPGKFTTFIAYEWSSTPGGLNLHRNVIFRGPRFPELPFSYVDSQRPEDLWAYLDRHRERGVQALAIPHNSNLSGGLMFDYKDSNGEAISREYAQTRMRNEREVEVTQTKGTSETVPELSASDEFAGFELYRYLLGTETPGALDGSYIRQAYARGLEIEQRIGVNPFKYGLVGGTDFHSGLTSTEENNYYGGHGRNDDAQSPAVALNPRVVSVGAPLLFSASGLTGVWAEENTREAIFAALERKETFATSGNRITVRLFAGWNFPEGMLQRPDWVSTAYATGVSMGADLPARPRDAARPTFIVQAIKDPDAANLDRIQIVKVWFEEGQSGERVFDVAWAGGRSIDPATGKLPAIGSTVNLEEATYTNDIGAAQLIAEWSDPEFDPSISAAYYARVLEIPTPRWSTYLAVRNQRPLPTDVPATIQERAWSSPVFYSP